MLWVVIGITYGTVVGWITNIILFRHMENNRRQGLEPLKGIGGIFFLRYMIDAAALLLFAYIIKDAWGIVASAISITISVKVSLLIVYTRKGGRFD